MKIIILYAFGGLLRSDFIAVQNYPPEYRVPYKDGQLPGFTKPVVDLSKIGDPVFKEALFVPTGRFVVLENKNTAQIYELESM